MATKTTVGVAAVPPPPGPQHSATTLIRRVSDHLDQLAQISGAHRQTHPELSERLDEIAAEHAGAVLDVLRRWPS